MGCFLLAMVLLKKPLPAIAAGILTAGLSGSSEVTTMINGLIYSRPTRILMGQTMGCRRSGSPQSWVRSFAKPCRSSSLPASQA